jgi:hypothetical protein
MAVWEIAIGSRGEKAFYERVLEQRSNTLRMCEQVWRKALRIAPDAPRRHIDAMHVVLSFLRGLVLYSELNADPAFIEAQLAVMTTALIGILKAKPKKTGRSRPQPRRR